MIPATVKYPIGIQTFSEIREEGYLYVDKTAILYNLVSTGKFYFLSRPRRFGKSLFLSTLKAYFEGRKELFEGLAIEKLETKWDKHPVIHLSLSSYDPSKENLVDLLENRISALEDTFGKIREIESISERFHNLIVSAYEKYNSKVVILIDEYDAPLIAHLAQEKQHNECRDLLKSIYVNLKELDEYIKFGMLTGVSRFSRMSIFSGINNLKDITLLPEFNEICGITQQELEDNFKEGITRLSNKLGLDYQATLAELKANYDGYHFTEDCPDIYNPFSLLNSMRDSRISDYWMQTGPPRMLAERLKHEREPLSKIFNDKVGESAISDIDTFRTSPLSILFQTGYLTIKGYDPRRKRYTLGIPNKEVESGFFEEILSVNTDIEKYRINNTKWDIRDEFEAGNPDKALSLIRSFFASIPAIVTRNVSELYFENNLYMLFNLIGLDARAEWWSSDGRIDMLLLLPDYIYVMELKLDAAPEEALAQIDRKEYTLQWENDGRKVYRIGINFSSEKRNIDTWLIERADYP